MNSIIVASPQVGQWGDFTAALENKCQMDVTAACSGAEVIAIAQKKPPVAVVIDQNMGDMAGIDLVLQLLHVNALINVALVSDQSNEVFHEKTEGLGILLKLPPIPDGQAALDFSECLTGVI